MKSSLSFGLIFVDGMFKISLLSGDLPHGISDPL